VMMNSAGGHLGARRGKFSTRMMMSCTAMPAQRILAFGRAFSQSYLVLNQARIMWCAIATGAALRALADVCAAASLRSRSC
jgi:alkylation response protein AidB-like acyl-CoA dehydrogenase